MLNNLPPKKSTPIKITQVKCQAPRVQSSVNESKEWHVPSSKDEEQNEENKNENNAEKDNEHVEG